MCLIMNYVMARPLRIELTDGIYHVTSRLILFTCETRCDTVEALNALSLWLFEVESEYMPEVLFNSAVGCLSCSMMFGLHRKFHANCFQHGK